MRLLQVVKIDSRTVSGQILASLRLLAHLLVRLRRELEYDYEDTLEPAKQHPPMARRCKKTKPDAVRRCHTHMSDLLLLSRPTGVQCTWGNLMQPLPPFSSANMPIPTLPRFFSILHNVPVGSRVELPRCLSPKGRECKKRGGMVRLHRVRMMVAELSLSVAIRNTG